MSDAPEREKHVPFGVGDIGGNLVEMLSQGLYGDPRDALREYVQNAVDAGATTVDIRFEGRDVTITDNGRGMDFVDLVSARRVGKSKKMTSETSVGFRGIGVYAGYTLCDRVLISTRQANSSQQWNMLFDFAAMRAILDQEKIGTIGSGETDLAPLIESNTRVYFEEVSSRSTGGTVVMLININKAAYNELADPKPLTEYLRRTLPVEIDSKFIYKDVIERFLLEHVPHYKSVRVRLRIVDISFDVIIQRTFPEDLLPPVFYEASYPIETDRVRAVMWACLSDSKTLKDEAGIFFKMRGFTIGSGREVRPLFRKRLTVFDWHVGEIYILDNNVKPNIARNDFETNQARRDLMSSLEVPIDDLVTRAVRNQQKTRATAVIEELEEKLVAFDARPITAINLIQEYENIVELDRRIGVQRIPARDEAFDEIRIRRDVIANKLNDRKSALRVRIDGQPATLSRPKDDDSDVYRREEAARENSEPSLSADLPPKRNVDDPNWIRASCVEIGMHLSKDAVWLSARIAAAIDGALDTGSVTYRSIRSRIEQAIEHGED